MRHSIGLLKNCKFQLYCSRQNSFLIRRSKPIHDNWLIHKFLRAHILMKQQFQSFLHQTLNKKKYSFSMICYSTYIWQPFKLSLLKHIKTFSSGISNVLQDPLSKLNRKSDCLTISHPTILAALKCL